MNNQQLVSIITPTYNHEKYIADCIRSVLNQTYTNWEMLIVDDGSKDNTYEIAKSFAETDNRIRVFTQPNVGIFKLAETYNFALSQSHGDYIAILEGDDWWFENKLELQMPRFINSEKIVLSWGQAYSSTVDLSHNYNLYPLQTEDRQNFLNKPGKPILSVLLFKNIIPALTIVIRKSVLMKIGGFIQKYNLPLVDLPTLQEVALLGEFDFIESPLGRWRNYPDQITKTYTVQIFNGVYALANDLYINHKNFMESLGINHKFIDNYFFDLFVINYSRSGRYKLIRKDYKGARADYYSSLFRYGFRKPIWKLRSIIGLVFSYLHLNVEGLAGILGKKRYN